MAHLEAGKTDVWARRIAFAGAFCLLLGMVWGLRADKAEAAAKPPTNKCAHVTAAAVFRDAGTDGIRSDDKFVYASPSYGSASEYHGWEDSTVCLMEYDDFDFIMGTASTKFELNGWDREVTLNFAANVNPPTPFQAIQTAEVTIRSDYVYDVAEGGPFNKRLIVWFTAGNVDYKLYFDDTDAFTNMAQVTRAGTAPNRIWTIEGSGMGRLEKVRNRTIIGYYLMPFKITIYETDKPKTCF